MKNKMNRASVPGRIVDLLWSDDEFCRDVSNHKKVSSSGKFPKSDQWCDEAGLNMAFALAGYSPDDVTVSCQGSMLMIGCLGSGNDQADSSAQQQVVSADTEVYPPKNPIATVQQGMIVRGIARRKFRVKFFVNPSFDLSGATAIMKNGLLEIFVPRSDVLEPINIDIKEK